jgi:hypothetical protein
VEDGSGIFDSLPGAGDVMAARPMAAMGTSREPFEQTCDVLRKIIEPRDVLCFHEEFSGIV